MERIGNIWSDATSHDNGMRAIYDGTKYKRKNSQVRRLLCTENGEIDIKKAEPYADALCDKLKNHTWIHKSPRHKTQYCRNRASSKGKWRELYIPDLEDHLVAHMLMQASIKAFTKGMHPHCCGSVPGRGIRHILKTVRGWMENDKQCRYFVKLDIRHFFDNIKEDLLKAKLRRKIKDKDILWGLDQIIESAPVACPIGYYTSPWFANLYLQDLDWYIEQQLYKERRGKRIKYVRHMLRYVDDILLIGTSKSDLKKAIAKIIKYLQNYDLEIKNSWQIKVIGEHEIIDGKWKLKPETYWCDIGGYKFCKDSVILRDGIFLASRRLVRKIRKNGYATLHQSQSINSRIGWASHCDCFCYLENEILPYVNIKDTRRVISDVAKKRKRRECAPTVC